MPKPTPDQILEQMAATFRQKNGAYGANYLMVGPIMTILFPNGVTLKTPEDFTKWHLVELIVIKLTRFACTNLDHHDSVHDMGVYAAMIESLLPEFPVSG